MDPGFGRVHALHGCPVSFNRSVLRVATSASAMRVVHGYIEVMSISRVVFLFNLMIQQQLALDGIRCSHRQELLAFRNIAFRGFSIRTSGISVV